MKNLKLYFIVLFVLIGLNSFAQWQHMNGPYTEDIKKIFYVEDTLYAISDFEIYKSFDNGENWIFYPNQSEIKLFKKIKSFEHKDSIFIAHTDSGRFISLNYGLSWQRTTVAVCDSFNIAPFPFTYQYIYPSIDNFKITNTYIYGSSSYGVYRMHLSDSVWIRMDTIKLLNNFLSLFIKDSVFLCGTHNQGIYFSNDYGASWQFGNNSDNDVHAFYTYNNCYYSCSNSGIFKSCDKGLNWINISASLPSNQSYYRFLVKDSLIYLNTVDSVLYVSINYGITWNTINKGLHIGSEYNYLQDITKINDTLYAGFRWSGVFKSIDNGKNWKQKSSGMQYARMERIVSFGDTLLAHTHSQGAGLLRSVDAGLNWETINSVDITNTVYELINDNNKLYMVHSEGLSVSEDYGNSWNRILTMKRVFSAAVQNNIIICGLDDHKTIISYNSGITWDSIHYDDNYGIVWHLQILGNEILVGGVDLYLSSDSGANFTNITTGLHNVISSFDYDGQHLIISTQQGIFYSNNKGATWDTIMNNNGFVIYPRDTYIAGNYVFISFHNKGIMYAKIGDFIWADYNQGFNSIPWYFTANDDYFYSATDEGVYRRPYLEAVSINEIIIDESKIKIYPNPTKDKIIIESKEYKIEYIEVYNLQASLLKRVAINDNKAELNISNLKTGCYFLKIVGDDKTFGFKVLKE